MRWIRRRTFPLLLALIVTATGCSVGGGEGLPELLAPSGTSSDGSANPGAGPPADGSPILPEIAEAVGTPIRQQVTAEGFVATVTDEVRVSVPEDTFATSVTFEASAYDVPIGLAVPALGRVTALRIATVEDVGPVDPPVVLSLTSDAQGRWVRLVDGTWESIEGDLVRLDHFSEHIIMQVRAWEREHARRQAERERLARLESEHQEWVRNEASQATRDFYGLDDNGVYVAPVRTHEQMCADILGAVGAHSDPASYEVDLDYSYVGLAAYLFEAGSPSQARYHETFWSATESTHQAITNRILAAEGPVPLGEVLRIAVEENGGNLPMGALAAHNVLKEIAYSGRQQADPAPDLDQPYLGDVSTDTGRVAAKLEPWRQTTPDNPSGRLDKMGSLYHVFAAATAGVFGPHEATGDLVSYGEELLRAISFGDDVPDEEKGVADFCGADLADAIGAGRDAAVTIEAHKVADPLTVTLSEDQLDQQRENGVLAYDSATVEVDLDPAEVTWIAWSGADHLRSDGRLGPGGYGTDDAIVVEVTGPDGARGSTQLDANDAYGVSAGPQAVIYGTAADAPDVFRRTPEFADPPDEELVFDEGGALNDVFATPGTYRFTFTFQNLFTEFAGHGDVWLLVGSRPS